MADPVAIAWEVMEYLLARLRDADPSAVNGAPAEKHVASGALFGFERSGLFDKQQAEGWWERINVESRRLLDLMRDETQHRVVAALTAPPSVERASVEEVLENQLRAVELRRRSLARSGRSSHPALNSARDAGQVMLHALAELGLIDELGEREWQARFERAADSNAEPLYTHSAEAIAADVAEASTAEAIPEVVAPLVHPLPDCSLDELVGVLMVLAPADSFARIESIVTYTDGMVITATMPAAEPGASRPPRLLARAQLTDDVGTYYVARGGGGGSGGTQRGLWRYVFAPALEPSATELRITIGDEQFVIALSDR